MPVHSNDIQQYIFPARNPGRQRACNAAADELNAILKRAPVRRQMAEGGRRNGGALRMMTVCWLLVFSLCLLTSGCARREPPADVTIINTAEPESLDPGICSPACRKCALPSACLKDLTRLDPKTARPIPGLARKLGHFAGRKHLHVSFAHESRLVHRRTDYGGRRGLFLDSRARSGDGFRLCRAAFLCEKRRGFQRRQNQRPVAGRHSCARTNTPCAWN